LTDQLLSNHNQFGITDLTILPSTGGIFEVTVNGDLIFSKKALGRFPEENEIYNLIREKYPVKTESASKA
jgi:selenoprotein W-related protein